MATMKDRILFVDDDSDQCELLSVSLDRLGYAVTTTTSPRHALELAGAQAFDVVLTDLGMPEMDGLELCERIIDIKPDIPVIIVTGQGTMESAVGAMRAGAYDFLLKPITQEALALTVTDAAKNFRPRCGAQRLRPGTVELAANGTLIGDSAAVRRVNDLIGRVGPSEASVLIQGETGAGKELIARALHQLSPRSQGPFVALNSAAVPQSLLESELFGYVKGAFTDAKASRQGLFQQAHGGTLFLDEIAEMPLDMQAKLLRALQERTVRPVGANHEVPFDTRILAATHRDLDIEVREHRFRQDLYYRLNVVRIDVPPLRERGTDILKLAAYFLEQSEAAKTGSEVVLSTQVAEKLMAYDWPGNVRELENCIEHATALARDAQLTVEDLPEKVRTHRAQRFSVATEEPAEILTLDELERRYITRVIKLLDGNKSRAALLLGLDRRTLYRKLERYQQENPGADPAAFNTNLV